MSASGGDDEFETGASLSIRIDKSSLSAARQQIERELSDIPVGIDAEVSGGRGAVGSKGPEPASIDLARRQLGHLEVLEELAIERNRFLDDGGGGGGMGAGSTLLQVQGARSVLGGAGGAIGGASLTGALAAGAGATATAGMVGAPLATFAQRLERIDLGDPLSFFFGEQADPANRPDIPEDKQINLQVPEDFPPELGLPTGFPPTLEVPTIDPLRVDTPTELPSINVDAPEWLRQVAEGLGIDISVTTESTVEVVDESLQRSEVNRFQQKQDRLTREQEQEVESIARSEVERFERALERRLGEL